MKTRYLALLIRLLQLLSIQKLQRLKIKYRILINLATNANLNTKATEIKDIITGISQSINTQEFDRLMKISFNARMKEAAESLASKTEVKDALDLGQKH